ncbi:MAG: DNA polymerase III subunit gamma/tau [Ignavibacteria bacterium]
MEYKVTARKWRPRIFSEVTSQAFITKTLKNSIKQNRISHAYLFSGPRGVGKTTVARILAKSLNCKNPSPEGDPCNVCDSCVEIDNDNRNHPDVFEIDGASNRNIEDVRELKEKVKYGPLRSKYKIFIIDEVHMLTGASFNALLKTLEEPPHYVVFIFATTAPEKVPLTILGRCQKFDFKRLTINEIIERLKIIAGKEKIKIDEGSLFFIAKKGDGSMRDAQGLFDMSAAYCDSDITFEKLKQFFNLAESDVFFNISTLIKEKNCEGLLDYFDELMNKGYDMQTFLDSLTGHYRNLLMAVSTDSVELIMESENVKQKYRESIKHFSQIEIINSLKLILQSEYTFKYTSHQRTLVEALLIELVKFVDTKDINSILNELKGMKSGDEPITRDAAAKNPGESKYKISSEPAREIKPVTNVSQNEPDVKTIYSIPASEPGTDTTSSTGYSAPVSIPVSMPASSGEAQSHWVIIIDSIKKERKWVYSMIKDSTFEIDSNKICRINIHENRYEFLATYQDYLTTKISDYFGQSLKINLVKNIDGDKSDIPSPPRKMEAAAAGNENIDKIRSFLIRELDARDVTDEEI